MDFFHFYENMKILFNISSFSKWFVYFSVKNKAVLCEMFLVDSLLHLGCRFQFNILIADVKILHNNNSLFQSGGLDTLQS